MNTAGTGSDAPTYAVFEGAAPESVWGGIADLFVDVFSAAPYFEDAAELRSITAWGPAKLSGEGGRLVVASLGGELIGFALVHALQGDAPWLSILTQLGVPREAAAAREHPGAAVIVHELAVRERSRGHGIARACLMRALDERAQVQTFIGVYERATEAAAMYRHWGLEEIGRVPMPGEAIALRVLTARTEELVARLGFPRTP